jgi:hypothetical protein
VTPSPNPFETPPSPKLAESPITAPPSPRSHGLGFAGEAPLGGGSAQPQLESLPRRTPLIAKILLKDPDFIKAGFHIGKFIIVAVDTEVDRTNIETLRTDLDSASTRINMSTPCIIVHYCLCTILTSPFRLETN